MFDPDPNTIHGQRVLAEQNFMFRKPFNEKLERFPLYADLNVELLMSDSDKSERRVGEAFVRKYLRHGELKRDFSNYYFEGDINLSGLGIKSLKGFPKEWMGTLDLSNNPIESLEGLPTKGYKISLSNTELETLEGLGDVERFYNTLYIEFTKIENLKGLENTNVESLYVKNRRMTSLEGIPLEVDYLQCLAEDYRPWTTDSMTLQYAWYKHIGKYYYADYWKDMLKDYIRTDLQKIPFIPFPKELITDEINEKINQVRRTNRPISKFKL